MCLCGFAKLFETVCPACVSRGHAFDVVVSEGHVTAALHFRSADVASAAPLWCLGGCTVKDYYVWDALVFLELQTSGKEQTQTDALCWVCSGCSMLESCFDFTHPHFLKRKKKQCFPLRKAGRSPDLGRREELLIIV